MTVEGLKSLGLTLGSAMMLKEEIDALASPAASSSPATASSPAAAAAGGGAAAVAASQPTSAPASSPDLQLKATAIASHHLPCVPLASLPPLTHVCGSAGASGCVYKIEFQGKDAAVKEFHKHMQGMLRRELKSLQLLAHPNIVRVMAVVNDAASQPVGLIMEYLPVPLDDAMQHMTLRQAVHALVEACIGVAVAHDAHVIHSDIKPANMLCSADFSVVKLADFGLAHAVTASLSSVSSARGTPLYVAHGGMACCCCT